MKRGPGGGDGQKIVFTCVVLLRAQRLAPSRTFLNQCNLVRFSVYFGLIILKCYFSRGKNNCCSCTQIAIRILRNNKVHFLEFLRTAIKQIHIKKNLRYKKVRFLEFLRKVMKENLFLRLVILISISGIPSVVDLYNVLHKYIILSKCPCCLRQVYLTHIPSPQ